jgi:hypothetical protein
MMRLQSYGFAIAAGVLQLIPSPGSLLGLPIGIWALFLLTRHEVHAAFIEAAEKTPVAVNRDTAKNALVIFAMAANLIFLVAFIASFSSRSFQWFAFLFGPLLLILDIFLYKLWKNKETFDSGTLSEQIQQGIRKTTNLKELLETDKPDKTRKKAIGSLVLGLASLLFTSFNMGFGGEFVFIFLPAFFSVLLGVTVIRTVQSYQDNRLDFGLAVAGIITGLISGIGLFAGLM